MDFISAEEFQKQPKEVQEVFLDWWQNNCSENDNDLVYYERHFGGTYKEKGIDIFKNVRGLYVLYPLFSETQLRKFIEEKTNSKIESEYYYQDKKGYDIWLYTEIISNRQFENLGHDLLQAYWKVACKVAGEVESN